MLDRYIGRPNRSYTNGKHLILDSFYCAEFLRYFYLAQTKLVNEDENQPGKLLDELVEENCMYIVNYAKINPFISSKEKLKHHKFPAIFKFHISNRQTHPEE